MDSAPGPFFGFRKTIQWYLDHEEWWRGILSGEYRLERLGTNG
nr:hypothetical protein [Akkermansia muciniphila]